MDTKAPLRLHRTEPRAVAHFVPRPHARTGRSRIVQRAIPINSRSRRGAEWVSAPRSSAAMTSAKPFSKSPVALTTVVDIPLRPGSRLRTAALFANSIKHLSLHWSERHPYSHSSRLRQTANCRYRRMPLRQRDTSMKGTLCNHVIAIFCIRHGV